MSIRALTDKGFKASKLEFFGNAGRLKLKNNALTIMAYGETHAAPDQRMIAVTLRAVSERWHIAMERLAD